VYSPAGNHSKKKFVPESRISSYHEMPRSHLYCECSVSGSKPAPRGSTSHAAVAANGIEDRTFCAVMSAAGLQVDLEKREAVIVDADGAVRHRLRKGDIVSLHGTSGEVYIGTRPLRLEGSFDSES